MKELRKEGGEHYKDKEDDQKGLRECLDNDEILSVVKEKLPLF